MPGRSDLWQRLSGPGLLILLLLTLPELLVRLGIAAGVDALRAPRLYAHPYCDDDYHRLRYRWRGREGALRVAGLEQHPQFGWAPPQTGDNPFSSDPATPFQPPLEQPIVALFGDSFMAGVTPDKNERIPLQLAAQMPGRKIVSFAVPGYGVDQMLLRVQSLLDAGDVAIDVMVVGIFLDDLDRVLERFRSAPKPYFTAVGEDMELRGVPIRETPVEWLQQNPVRFRSYFAALARTFIQRSVEGGSLYESQCRVTEKKSLNEQILLRMTELARQRQIRMLFVVFYPPWAIRSGSWRSDFLTDFFYRENLHYVDVRPLLLAYSGDIDELYRPPPDGHLSGAGNEIVAVEIARRIQSDGPEPVPPSVLRLGAAGSARRFLGVGWADAQGGVTFTDEPTATARLATPSGEGPLTLEAELMRAVAGPEDPRTLTIAVNGVVAASVPLASLPAAWQLTTIEASLDPDLVRADVIEVAFDLPYLVTPRSLGINEDRRQLGVAVRSISVRRNGS